MYVLHAFSFLSTNSAGYSGICLESSYLWGRSRNIRSSRSFLAAKQVQDQPGYVVSTHQNKQKQESVIQCSWRQNIDFAALFFSDCVLEISTGLYFLIKSFLNHFISFRVGGTNACTVECDNAHVEARGHPQTSPVSFRLVWRVVYWSSRCAPG